MLKTLNGGVPWLTRVSIGLVFLNGTERLESWGGYPRTQKRETGAKALTGHLTRSLPGKVYAKRLEKRFCKITEPKRGGYPVRFSSRP